MRNDPNPSTVPLGSPLTPHHSPLLPYGRQEIDEADIAAVAEVLRSRWLTTGPAVERFEQSFAETTGAKHAVAVSSGTAALHAAMHVHDLHEGDEVIVPAMTFAATANAVRYAGARPVFADVDPDTLLVGPEQIEHLITPRTRAVMAVDYAGQPCDYDGLRELCRRRDLALVSDACHSLGARYRGRAVGTLADLTTFSFHPVKAITSAEGGMITTDEDKVAERLRRFRNHGISVDLQQREAQETWFYEQVELGFNYRLSDVHAALGCNQLRRLAERIERRQRIAAQYDAPFAGHDGLRPLLMRDDVEHAYHLYVVRINLAAWRIGRKALFAALRAAGLGVQVHYIPVHLHPYYRRQLGTHPGLCPAAEAAYEEIITLPLFPGMTDDDIHRVVECVNDLWNKFRRKTC